MNKQDQSEILKNLDQDAKEAFQLFNYHLTVAAEKSMLDLPVYGHAFIYIDKDLKPRCLTLEDIKNKFDLEKTKSLILSV